MEGGGASGAGAALRRQPLPQGRRGLRRRAPARAARPRLRRPAHARRRRQRAHQHPGQLRQLRDAAGGERRGRAHHAARALARRRDLGRARHRDHEARVPGGRRDRGVPRLQGGGRPRGEVQPGEAPARRRPAGRVHAVVQPDRRRVADPGGVRDRPHRRLDQGLPALRQVQAGVRDARAAREPALLAAQQDPRGLAPDRGVPVRGADAPRRQLAALRRVRRRRRPLHGVPQVREPVPGGHRLRGRVDRDAQPPAQAGQEARQSRAPPRRCSSSTPPTRRRSSSCGRA